jgi:SAM-dependent methyltransferase
MSKTAQKWDQKHQATLDDLAKNAKTPSPAPAWALQKHADYLPLKGRALDLASGFGGNALFMARCGLKVEAWDISDVALTHLNNVAAVNHLPIQPVLTDLEQMILPHERFDVIVVSRYLNRALLPQIEQALKPNGTLYYQTFLAPVQENGPQNPKYYLQSGELPKSFSNLSVELYGEGWLPDDSARHRYAWMIGRKSNACR